MARSSKAALSRQTGGTIASIAIGTLAVAFIGKLKNN